MVVRYVLKNGKHPVYLTGCTAIVLESGMYKLFTERAKTPFATFRAENVQSLHVVPPQPVGTGVTGQNPLAATIAEEVKLILSAVAEPPAEK